MAGLDVTPVPTAGRQVISGYGGGGFKVAGHRYDGSLILFSTRAVPWPVRTAAEITWPALSPVYAGGEAVQVLIVGCGRTFRAPPPDLRESLRAAGLALEWMDTGAACRTFNVLLLDNREVAAALLAVE